jgi:Fe2+ or Zn2+ uptake regulation protein
LVCQDCGRVIEFENPEMLELGRGICEQLGFATVGWRLQVVGACKAFHEQGTCPHRGRPD